MGWCIIWVDMLFRVIMFEMWGDCCLSVGGHCFFFVFVWGGGGDYIHKYNCLTFVFFIVCFGGGGKFSGCLICLLFCPNPKMNNQMIPSEMKENYCSR